MEGLHSSNTSKSEENIYEFKYISTESSLSQLVCPKCDFKTIYTSYFEKHKKCWNFCCYECGFLTSLPEVLSVHNERQHGIAIKKYQNNRYKCRSCDFSSKSSRDLKTHTNKQLNCFKFKCKLPNCEGLMTSKLSKYRIHMKDKHGRIILKREAKPKRNLPQHPCHLCPVSDHFLTTHSVPGYTYKDGSYNCHKCSFNDIQKSNINAHLIYSHACFRFQCPNCPYRANQIARLQRHNCNLHESRRENIFLCKECPFKSHNNSFLTNHVETVHEGIVLKCNKCSFGTSFKSELKNHLLVDHNIRRQLNCTSCSFIAESLHQLKDHINSNHLYYKSNENGSLTCLLCPFTPISTPKNAKGSIKRHVESNHVNENDRKKIICSTCKETFSRISSLHLHKSRKHIDSNASKKFPCTYTDCEYIVNEKWLLKRHVDKLHLDKRFPCSFCNYTGYDKRNLENHTQNTHIKGSKNSEAFLKDWHNKRTGWQKRRTKRVSKQIKTENSYPIDIDDGELIDLE